MIYQYLKTATGSSFVKNVAKLASGTALGQIILLSATPLLTRIYSPEAFGIYGLMLALTMPLATLVTGRYELAIILPKSEITAVSLLQIAQRCAAVCTCVIALAVLIWRDICAEIFNDKSFSDYWWFLPLSVYFAVQSTILENWVTRRGNYSQLSKSAPLSSAVSSIVAIALGWLTAIPGFLLVGNLAGSVFKVYYFKWLNNKKIRGIIYERKVTKTLKEVAVAYKDFPLYRAPQDLLNSLSQNIIGILLAYYFSTEVMAQYWLAHRIVASPLSLISGAVGQVFYQKTAAVYNRNENIYQELKTKTLWLAAISIPLSGIMALLLPVIFPVVFGPAWSQAGDASFWLAAWMGIGFINTPAVKTLDILRLQKIKLIHEAIVLILRISVISYFADSGRFLVTVASFCVLGMIANLILILIAFKASKNHTYKFVSA